MTRGDNPPISAATQQTRRPGQLTCDKQLNSRNLEVPARSTKAARFPVTHLSAGGT
jgi:hypothetical protein